MGLGGAGGSAAAVPAGAPAQKDDKIAGRGAFPPDVCRRSRADDRAYLHALGGVAGVIKLVHLPGGHAYLIAVGGVARRRGGDKLALGQLAFYGFADGAQRVRRAGDAHGGVNIAAA